jgi:hypothetical protein
LSDPKLLAAALVGFEQQRLEIEKKVAEMRRRLGGRAAVGTVSTDGAELTRKRAISAAGRRRIAAAQRKWWAALRKTHPGAAAAKRAVPCE